MGGTGEWTTDADLCRMSDTEIKSEKDWSRWLRTMQHPKAWGKEVFTRADTELSKVRDSTMPDAGGLIVADGKREAGEWAELIEGLTGRRPVVVHSDEVRSGQLIERFRRSKDRWIVAVDMISEGVDIRRLRVLIYASSDRTQLVFIQRVGRVIRGHRPPATVFLLRHPELVEHAMKIKEARIAAYKKLVDKPGDGSDDWDRPFVEFLSGEPEARGGIHDGTFIEENELDGVRVKLLQKGSDLREADLMSVVELLKEQGAQEWPKPPPSQADGRPPETKSQRVKRLKTTIARIVQGYAHRHPDPTGDVAKECHVALNKAVGIRTRRDATEDQLLKMLSFAKEWYG
jgi:superfamily II DNA/RNA helicase